MIFARALLLNTELGYSNFYLHLLVKSPFFSAPLIEFPLVFLLNSTEFQFQHRLTILPWNFQHYFSPFHRVFKHCFNPSHGISNPISTPPIEFPAFLDIFNSRPYEKTTCPANMWITCDSHVKLEPLSHVIHRWYYHTWFTCDSHVIHMWYTCDIGSNFTRESHVIHMW